MKSGAGLVLAAHPQAPGSNARQFDNIKHDPGQLKVFGRRDGRNQVIETQCWLLPDNNR